MSDQWGPGGDGNEWARPSGDHAEPTEPFAPPPEHSAVEPSLTLESEQAVRTGGGVAGGRVVAGIVGVLVLLAGAVFAVTQVGSTGPSSAEEAVRELLDAASHEDVLGLLAALDPGERDTLRGPVEDLFGELQRLEVLDDDFELGGVTGIDLEFTDVELRSEPVRDDLVRVYFTAGTVTAGVDGDEIPVGAFMEETLERFEADLSGLQESETTPLADDDTFVVARNGSDGWRVSIGYTAAEAARLDAGLPLPAAGLAPVGADSPEAAVEGMVLAAAELDLAGVIARLSPAEMGALHDYAPLFLDQAQQSLDEEAGDVEVSIDELELRSETSGDRGTVFVDAFGLTVTYQGDTVSVTMEGECFEVSGSMLEEQLEGTPFEDGPVCADELTEGYEDVLGDYGVATEDLDLPELPPVDPPELGISTARVDGGWFVAPVATFLDGTVEVLSVLERAHLDAAVEFAESFMFGFASEQAFEEVGDSIDSGSDEAPEPILPDPSGGFGEGSMPTTTWQFETGTASSYDPAVLYELAYQVAGGDPDVTLCLEEVLPLGDEIALVELLDSWQYGYEPSAPAQQLLRDAMAQCGVG